MKKVFLTLGLLLAFTSISMTSSIDTVAFDVHCSDPDGSDWIERRAVDGQYIFIIHTTRPSYRLTSVEHEVEYEITPSDMNFQCLQWNN